MSTVRILPTLLLALLPGCAWRGETLRALDRLGAILVPRRLEDRSPEQGQGWTLYRFDRVADSFLLMGSHTPIRERLTVLAWASGSAAPPEAERAFRIEAVERVESLRWRREGDLEIGEGIHRVNTHETPAWVVLHHPPGARYALGYMVWRKDAGLEEALRTARRLTSSVRRPGGASGA